MYDPLRKMGRLGTAVAFIASALLAGAGNAYAQDFPTRPVRIVLGNAPGGTNDIIGRLVAQKLTERVGSPFFLENRGGGSGAIGAGFVALSPPDGHTLLLITPSHLLDIATGRVLPYHPLRDFAPVTQLAAAPYVIMMNPELPAKTLQEVISLLKREPGKYNFASTGLGSFTQLAGEAFKLAAGVNIVHVPYQGGGPALKAVIANEVSFYFAGLAGAKSFRGTGKMAVMAIMSDARSPIFPDVPTTAEAGLPDYRISGWYGLLAPAKTPPAVVSKLRAETAAVLHSPDLVQRLDNEGAIPGGSTPEEFTRFLADELRRLTPVAKAANLRAE